MNTINKLWQWTQKPAFLGRYAPIFAMSVLYLVLSVVLRLVLWGSFGIAGGVPAAHLPATLSLGLLNDLVALVYVTFPASLYLSLLPAKWFDSKANRRIIIFTLFAVIYGLLYLCVAEFFFFEEFDSRFNLIAVDYLIYPTEVLVNIWETYPVVKVLLATFVLTVGILRGMWPMIRRYLSGEAKFIQRAKFLAVHTVILLLVTAGVSADSLAPFANRITNELTANGITSFFHAFRTNEINYEVHYKTMDSQRAYAVMREHLKNSGGQFTADKPDNLERTFPAKPGLGKMNVVVVVEESLGSEFVGAHGDKASLTPNLDRLSKEGLFFTNMYASGTRTVRGLEAISLSLPPIPSESVVKRPGNENMTNWGKVMADNGYQTSFLYGGYGYFDNMNYFFQSNGFAISDRTEIPQPTFANIWGVSDEDLFNHAQKYFDTAAANGKPFFSIIMSTSNHKPFTFPEGIPGIPAKGGGRDAGVRYADYAIGKFVEQSRSHAWFNNTLFIFVADHDARVYGKAQIPLKTYEIPMLIYAPGKVAPGEVDALASQIDIAPTVLGMLGLPYKASFYGRDVLAPNKTPNTLVFNHNYDVAILRDNQLTILGMGKKVSAFSYDRKTDKQIAIPVDPQSEDLAKAYYQTAYDLFKRHQY